MISENLSHDDIFGHLLSEQGTFMSYWGPLEHSMSDNILVMLEVFLKNQTELNSDKKFKSLFSSCVELLQNISDYNQKAGDELDSSCFLEIRALNDKVLVQTRNNIIEKDVESIKEKFQILFSMDENLLEESHKHALLNGESLGLIMLRRVEDSDFEWNIDQDKNNKYWLSLKFSLNYG